MENVAMRLAQLKETLSKLSTSIAIEEENIKRNSSQLKEFGIENLNEAETAIEALQEDLKSTEKSIIEKLSLAQGFVRKFKEIAG